MHKTYQIYASSIEGTGSDLADQEFIFDWGIIPEGEYEMTWALMSKSVKITTALGQIESVPIKVEFVVPFMTDRYEVNKLTGYAGSSNIAGFIYYYDSPHTGGHHMRQFRAVNTDNAGVIVRGKPSGNKFKVRFLNVGLTLGTMLEYEFVITFKSVC